VPRFGYRDIVEKICEMIYTKNKVIFYIVQLHWKICPRSVARKAIIMPNESTPDGKSSGQNVAKSAERKNNKALPRVTNAESSAPVRIGKGELKSFLMENLAGESHGQISPKFGATGESSSFTVSSDRENADLRAGREASDSSDAVPPAPEDLL
jgi:hypothetical protein